MYGTVPITAPAVVAGACVESADAATPARQRRRLQLGQAEVQQLRLRRALSSRAGLREHDVGRLEITMDDAVAVRGCQRIGDLRAQFEHLRERQRPLAQALGKRLAVEVLHHQKVDGLCAVKDIGNETI